MTTPKVAKDLFADVQAAFTPIVGAPNDDNGKRLNEAFINAFQSMDVPDDTIDLSDILLIDAKHEAKHGDGSMLERMAIPLSAYEDSIAADANNAVHAKAKRLWTAKIELQRLIKTAERAGRAFLVAVIEDTWLLPLKEEATFYNKVPLRDFFARLKDGSGSLEATDIVSLLSAHHPRVSERRETMSVASRLPLPSLRPAKKSRRGTLL